MKEIRGKLRKVLVKHPGGLQFSANPIAMDELTTMVQEYILGIIGDDEFVDYNYSITLRESEKMMARNSLRQQQRAKLTSGEVIKDEL